MKLRVKFRAEDQVLMVGIFEQFCRFDEVFLMALTFKEHLFIERPVYTLYRRFLYNDHLPYFQ